MKITWEEIKDIANRLDEIIENVKLAESKTQDDRKEKL